MPTVNEITVDGYLQSSPRVFGDVSMLVETLGALSTITRFLERVSFQILLTEQQSTMIRQQLGIARLDMLQKEVIFTSTVTIR